jgi:hypothetical protein
MILKRFAQPFNPSLMVKLSNAKVQLVDSTSTPTSYRYVIKFLKRIKADFHTYQPKQERAYRIVVRNLHHTTCISDIKEELLSNGHFARNINNVLQYNTKRPLPLFFINIEQANNNKDIFKIEFLCYSKIKIEEPHIKLLYNVSVANNMPIRKFTVITPLTVSTVGINIPQTPVKNLRINHPNVYYIKRPSSQLSRMSQYKQIQFSYLTGFKTSKQSYTSNENSLVKNEPINIVNTTSNSHPHQNISYAQEINDTNNSSLPSYSINNIDDFSLKITSFLDGLKNLMNPLISLLTTVINKLLTKSNDI